MAPSLTYLAWTLLLALLQIVAAAVAKRLQEPPGWAAGPRDADEPRYTGIAGRLARAQSNLFETLPLFVGAVLLAHAAGREGSLTAWGASLFLWGRLAFVAIYAAGIPYLRTLVWIIATAGLVLVIAASLLPG